MKLEKNVKIVAVNLKVNNVNSGLNNIANSSIQSDFITSVLDSRIPTYFSRNII